LEKIMAEPTHMDVSYIAHLARIHITEEETRLFQGQLDQVLTYVEQLGELDVSNVEATAHAMPLVNVLRDDTPQASLDSETVLANAPAARDGQILVPKIME
jgi:aspartyl-tRNA(Asn)/glutamyl-tRNA(Gln) amidotransferase subunit C